MSQTPEILIYSCRRDAGEPEEQERLEAAAVAGTSFICGHCQGRGLRLFPFFDPLERGFNVRCAPSERKDHARDCWVVSGGPLFDAEPTVSVRYSDHIFRAAGLPETGRPQYVTRREGTGAWNGDLTHLVHSCLMRASLEVFRDWNRGFGYRDRPIGNPSRDEIFYRLVELLHEPLLADRRSPARAARALGLRILFGTTNERLVDRIRAQRLDGRAFDILLDDLCDGNGPLPMSGPLRVPPSVGHCAGGKVMAYANVIPPPYFVFCTATTSGEVVRLVIVPMAPISGALFTAESAAEQLFLKIVAALGAGIIKLCVNIDLRLLGPALMPLHTDTAGHLSHRPDAILFIGGRIWIVEVAGSNSTAYNRVVDRRLERMREFNPASIVSLRKIGLKELSEAKPLFELELKGVDQ